MKHDDLFPAVKQLEQEGLLPPGQAEPVARRLGELLLAVDLTKGRRDGASRAASIIGWMGGMLVAAGVLYFVAFHYEELSKWGKLALIFGSLVGLHVGGWWLAEETKKSPAIGSALTLAGMVALGGAIYLVAQIYHLEAHWPHAILAWWVLNLPFALLLNQRRALAVVVALFSFWALSCVDVWTDDHLLWRNELAFAVAILALGAFGSAAAALCRPGKYAGFTPLLGGLGQLALLGGLFPLSFHEFFGSRDPRPLAELFASERLHEFWLLCVPAAWIAGAALLVLGAALWRRKAQGFDEFRLEPLDAILSLLVVAGMVGAVICVPDLSWMVANLALLAAVVLLVLRGVRLHRVWDVNLAVIVFLATVLARYFEWLPEGLGLAWTFLGSGVVLLGLGYFLERLRRRFVAEARRSLS